MVSERSGNIWLVSSNRWNSAITEYALSSVRSIQAQGYHCLFSPLAGSPAEKRAQKQPFKTISLPTFNLTSLRDMTRIAKDFKPDVVISFGGPETVLANLAGRAYHQGRIIRFRGQDLQAAVVGRLRERVSSLLFRSLVVPGAALAGKMRTVLPGKSVHLLPLGCDEEVFRWLQGPVIDERDLLVVGRLDPVKGHARCFEIYAHFKRFWEQQNFGRRPKLKIIGESANITPSDLHCSAAGVGLVPESDYFIVNQKVSAIADHMRQALLGIIPSTGSEFICRVAQEFLLVGTPIAVSGVGSLSDCLFQGAGFSYQGISSENAGRMLATLAKKYQGENDWARQSRAESALKNYSLSAMGLSWSRLLDELYESS